MKKITKLVVMLLVLMLLCTSLVACGAKFKVDLIESEGGSYEVSGEVDLDEVKGNSQLTITAKASEGYNFLYWEKNGQLMVGSSETITVTIVADVSYKAVFEKVVEPQYYTVTITSTEGGAATNEVHEQLVNGQSLTVNLTAEANSGYTFLGWFNGDELVSKWAVTTATITVAGSDITYTAKFARLVVATVSTLGGGEVSVNGAASAEVIEGGKFELVAQSTSGYQFGSWQLDGVVVSYESIFTTTVAGDYTAVFYDMSQANVTVNDIKAGRALIANIVGSDIVVKAQANSGYRFVCWQLNDVVSSQDAIATFSYDSDTEYKAVFEKVFNVSVEFFNGSVTLNNEKLTSNKAVVVSSGSEVMLVAEPITAYQFDGWYNGDTLLSSDLTYTLVVDEDTTLSAMFSKIPVYYTVSIGSATQGNAKFEGHDDTVLELLEGSFVTLVATSTTTGYDFIGWMINGVFSSKPAKLVVEVGGDATYVPVFSASAFKVIDRILQGANYKYNTFPEGNQWKKFGTDFTIGLSSYRDIAVGDIGTLGTFEYYLRVQANVNYYGTGNNAFLVELLDSNYDTVLAVKYQESTLSTTKAKLYFGSGDKMYAVDFPTISTLIDIANGENIFNVQAPAFGNGVDADEYIAQWNIKYLLNKLMSASDAELVYGLLDGFIGSSNVFSLIEQAYYQEDTAGFKFNIGTLLNTVNDFMGALSGVIDEETMATIQPVLDILLGQYADGSVPDIYVNVDATFEMVNGVEYLKGVKLGIQLDDNYNVVVDDKLISVPALNIAVAIVDATITYNKAVKIEYTNKTTEIDANRFYLDSTTEVNINGSNYLVTLQFNINRVEGEEGNNELLITAFNKTSGKTTFAVNYYEVNDDGEVSGVLNLHSDRFHHTFAVPAVSDLLYMVDNLLLDDLLSSIGLLGSQQSLESFNQLALASGLSLNDTTKTVTTTTSDIGVSNAIDSDAVGVLTNVADIIKGVIDAVKNANVLVSPTLINKNQVEVHVDLTKVIKLIPELLPLLSDKNSDEIASVIDDIVNNYIGEDNCIILSLLVSNSDGNYLDGVDSSKLALYIRDEINVGNLSSLLGDEVGNLLGNITIPNGDYSIEFTKFKLKLGEQMDIQWDDYMDETINLLNFAVEGTVYLPNGRGFADDNTKNHGDIVYRDVTYTVEISADINIFALLSGLVKGEGGTISFDISCIDWADFGFMNLRLHENGSDFLNIMLNGEQFGDRLVVIFNGNDLSVAQKQFEHDDKSKPIYGNETSYTVGQEVSKAVYETYPQYITKSGFIWVKYKVHTAFTAREVTGYQKYYDYSHLVVKGGLTATYAIDDVVNYFNYIGERDSSAAQASALSANVASTNAVASRSVNVLDLLSDLIAVIDGKMNLGQLLGETVVDLLSGSKYVKGDIASALTGSLANAELGSDGSIKFSLKELASELTFEVGYKIPVLGLTIETMDITKLLYGTADYAVVKLDTLSVGKTLSSDIAEKTAVVLSNDITVDVENKNLTVEANENATLDDIVKQAVGATSGSVDLAMINQNGESYQGKIDIKGYEVVSYDEFGRIEKVRVYGSDVVSGGILSAIGDLLGAAWSAGVYVVGDDLYDVFGLVGDLGGLVDMGEEMQMIEDLPLGLYDIVINVSYTEQSA